MNKKKIVSIIVPTYNSEKNIVKCIEAIKSSDYNEIEIIVVDDCSKDSTVKLIKSKFKESVNLKKLDKNKGPAHARNLGVKYSKGLYLLFIDSDILIKKDTITLMIEAINHNKRSVISQYFSSDYKYNSKISEFNNLFDVFLKNEQFKDTLLPNTSCLMIKKEIFNEIKFNEKIKYACIEDLEFGLNLRKKEYKVIMNKDISVDHIKEYSFISLIKMILTKSFYRIKLLKKSRLMATNHIPKNSILLFLSLIVMFSMFIAYGLNAFIYSVFSYLIIFTIINIRFIRFISQRTNFLNAIYFIFLSLVYVVTWTIGSLLGMIKK